MEEVKIPTSKEKAADKPPLNLKITTPGMWLRGRRKRGCGLKDGEEKKYRS